MTFNRVSLCHEMHGTSIVLCARGYKASRDSLCRRSAATSSFTFVSHSLLYRSSRCTFRLQLRLPCLQLLLPPGQWVTRSVNVEFAYKQYLNHKPCQCNPCEDFCPEYLRYPASEDPSCPISPSSSAYCDGVPKQDDENVYLCGNYRLGPVKLPSMVPVANLVESYDRLGGLCPAQFLGNWTDEKGSFRYPEETGGYVTDIHCKRIKGTVRLQKGTLLDRFGGETGNFLSPKGAPYTQRALPPANLNNNRNNASDYPNGYHVYEVVKAFEVYAGPIAEWFGQPGGGTQYVLLIFFYHFPL